MSNRLPWIVAGTFAVLFLASMCGGASMVKARDQRVDSLRTETLAARASAQGWEVRFGSEVARGETLAGWLQEARDSTALLASQKAELAAEVELLGGRILTLTDLYASVVGQVEAHDATVHTSALEDAAPQVDSVTAPVDDGLLTGRLAYFPPASLSLEYSVELALALGWTVGADGRALATAMASDPRVRLRVGEAWYQPPAPIAHCSFGTRAKDHGRGYAVLRLLEFALAELWP